MVAAKATVAGAGALGLSCALALAEAGFEVVVCDPAPDGANASGVAAGMLAPVFEAVLDPGAEGHFGLLLAARDLWPALAERAGVQIDRSGALAAGRRDWLDGIAARMLRLGLHAIELPERTAQALAPGLAHTLEASLLTREDWRLDAPSALAALRAAAEGAGVRFRAERVRERPPGELLILATGWDPDLQTLAPELGRISPIKGHILRVRHPEAWGCTVRGEGGYAAPCAGGFAVGATMENGVGDPAPDPSKAEPLLAMGARLFPAIAKAPYELLAGVRGATPDGLPLVGPGASPGVLLAVGARRNGWLLAPLVGRMIAAYASGSDPGRHAAALAADRFG